MAALPIYISIPEAASRLGVDEANLRRLVSAGRMKAITLNGEIAVSEESIGKKSAPASVPGIQKSDLPEYKKFAHLAGVEIGVGEAARKYKVATSTMYKWYRSNYIQGLGQIGQKVLLNEQDVAYCAEIYHANAGQGKWLFNKDGTPYKKTEVQYS
jgi:hypothetical protein